MTLNTSGNQLADETSPYLRQHASNPVHWRPWGPAALAEAAQLDRPILLSIGYSACHWCHVMAHESFEDDATAALMNRHFVNIKVDREERPDLDQIYQLAHQLITRAPGGWPLTMFLAPGGEVPFFGGTYFPPVARHGAPAFPDVLTRVSEFYRDHRDEIHRQGAAIVDVFRQTDAPAAAQTELSEAPLLAARQALLAEFDSRHGGFGSAPKFPQPGSIDLLLRHWFAHSDPPEPDLQALYMATRTLHAMAEGGLFDQVGGGFFRYSVDAGWQIPHFEKMLYDNAALLALYAEAYRATDERLFWRVANETADWMCREMRAPDGGFCASLDADSAGREGAYYVWSDAELRATLGRDSKVAMAYFGASDGSNFDGQHHLVVAQPDALPLDDEAAQETLARARTRLFAVREQRDPPQRDDKVITAWNGQTIRAFAIAARHLQRADLADMAAETVDFLRGTLFRDGRLLAVYAGGKARLNGYLDDYAFLLEGLLEMLQTRFRVADIEFAVALAETLLEHFQDPVDGGFFFTSDDHEALLHRMKPLSDGAMPAGNGVAARALLRLGHLLGETRYLHAAEATVRLAWEPLSAMPHGHSALLGALDGILQPPEIVVVRAAESDLPRWRSTTQMYAPRRMALFIPDPSPALPGLLAQRTARKGGVAYLCRGQTCAAPIESPEALLVALRQSPSERDA